MKDNKDVLILRTREEVLNRICEECDVQREDKTSGYLTRDEGIALLLKIREQKSTGKKG